MNWVDPYGLGAGEEGDALNDYPADPDDWDAPDGVTEELGAKNNTNGKHRQWKDKNGNIVRRWDKGDPNEPGWRGKDHWHDADGNHILPE
ncbi:MAG: hypothetical protein NC924_04405 [Candidatus Omnitrophica bacterium]|nr:hypothetical protein [Candidatus Omnitrophota bacterium]